MRHEDMQKKYTTIDAMSCHSVMFEAIYKSELLLCPQGPVWFGLGLGIE